MELSHEYLENPREFKNYEEFCKNCKLKMPKEFNFAYDVVDRYAKEEPQKKALVWIDDLGEEKIFTFKDISIESQKAANWFLEKGIKKGDTVMLILRRRYEWWFLIIALHRIGAIAIPATDQLLQADIEYRINAAEVKMIISYDNSHILSEVEKAVENSTYAKQLVTVGPNRKGWISFHDEYKKCKSEFLKLQGKDAIRAQDPMLLYFTSGTSGYPKMVLQNYLYPIGHIMTAKYWHGVEENGLHLTIAETGWAKSAWGKLYGQWICGSAVFVYDMNMLKPDKMLNMISKYRLTSFCAPPTVYRFLVHQDLSKYDLSECKRFTTAGEALNDEVFNRWKEKTGKNIFEGYGQTEATIICGNFLEYSKIKPGSMGRPNPLYKVEVLDLDGKPIKEGQIGELCIRTDFENCNSSNCNSTSFNFMSCKKESPFGLLMGYFKNEELTKTVYEGGVYHTGDNVTMDKDGYVWFVGRKDDIIKSAGYRISPFEVESVLQKHPAVMECAVTGVKDLKRGMAIKASIVLSKLYEHIDLKTIELEIANFVKENIAMYKCPRIYEFLKELPKTISGKIRRAAIREKDKLLTT